MVFDTSKFANYDKFARLDLEKQFAGARVEVDSEKKKPWDFLLWVTNQPKHIMQWDSPWDRGFPGWHIECSAMAMKYFGDSIDIHAGGQDLMFPHHENEIAQSEGATGKPFVHHWMHVAFVRINQEKMSKSLGNFFVLKEALSKINKNYFSQIIVTTGEGRGWLREYVQ